MPRMSDKKDAAQIAVGLSGQLISGALTMIALSGAFLTFILDKKDPSWIFYITYLLSFILFVISIFCGGRGTDAIKRNGESGTWTTDIKPDWFEGQAISLLLAVILLAMLPFLGKSKTDDDGLDKLQKSMQQRDSLQTELFKKLLQTKPLRDTVYIIKTNPAKNGKACKKNLAKIRH